MSQEHRSCVRLRWLVRPGQGVASAALGGWGRVLTGERMGELLGRSGALCRFKVGNRQVGAGRK